MQPRVRVIARIKWPRVFHQPLRIYYRIQISPIVPRPASKFFPPRNVDNPIICKCLLLVKWPTHPRLPDYIIPFVSCFLRRSRFIKFPCDIYNYERKKMFIRYSFYFLFSQLFIIIMIINNYKRIEIVNLLGIF